MSVAAVAREAQKKDGERQFHLQGAVKIYKGTLVNARVADGYGYPARSGTSTDTFLGVAFETVDNSAGVAGATGLQVNKTGSYTFVAAFAAVQTDIGAAVYASDDSTVTKTSTNNQLVGYIREIINSALVRVASDQAAR